MLLTAVQVACLLCALVGLALLAGVAWALLAGGIIGVVACELAEARRRTQAREPAA